MWTFEMRWKGGPDVWQTSAKRVDTIQEAAQFAAEWMVTCTENGQTVETRLVESFTHGDRYTPTMLDGDDK